MLPKIEVPKHEILVPSKNEKLWFRPFLVKEEKILLMAGESGQDKDILDAIKQILTNCCLDELDVAKLAVFDLEYVFLKLRSISVDNICKLSFDDLEDKKTYNFEVDLDKLELVTNDEHTNIIEINDSVKIKMKYPTVDITDKMETIKSEVEILDKLVLSCVDSIYDSETVYEGYTEDELREFMNGLEGKVYGKIREFFDTMPKVYHKIEYTNEMGSKREIELRSIKDFFSWG